MEGKPEGEKEKRVKKKRPARAESKDKVIPPTAIDAAPAAKAAPVAEELPVRYEGCGPCRRAVPDVPLSDSGRSSRDLLFALFFVAWAIGDLVIAIIGFKTGAPQALVYGLDYSGGVCGRNNPVRQKRVLVTVEPPPCVAGARAARCASACETLVHRPGRTRTAARRCFAASNGAAARRQQGFRRPPCALRARGAAPLRSSRRLQRYGPRRPAAALPASWPRLCRRADHGS